RVLLARGELLERLGRARDRRVGVAPAFGHLDGAVAHLDKPLPLALHVEEVRVVDPLDLRRVCALLERREEFPGPHQTCGNRSSGSRRAAGRRDPRTTAASGTSAAVQSAARRSIESATAPSATAPTPPRPIEKPIESPEAIPIRLGRYSWLSTIVTPKVP